MEKRTFKVLFVDVASRLDALAELHQHGAGSLEGAAVDHLAGALRSHQLQQRRPQRAVDARRTDHLPDRTEAVRVAVPGNVKGQSRE